MADVNKSIDVDKLSTRAFTGLLGDIRKTNNFIVTIEGVSKGNNLDLVIDKAFLPKVSVSVLTLTHGNDAKKLAGTATWDGGSLVIHDTLSRDELDALIEWQEQVYNAGVIGLASDYKKTATITEFAADGRYQRTWKLNGVWISDLDLGTLDASTSNLKQITCTLQIDPSDSLRPKYHDDINLNYNN